jgi:hypothetical protein
MGLISGIPIGLAGKSGGIVASFKITTGEIEPTGV